MERDQISIDDLIQRLLNFDSIDCRICLRKQDEDWHLTHIVGDVNRPDFIKSEWINTYLDVAFIRDVIATTELSSWLANLRGELRTCAFQIPEFHAHVQQERHSSAFSMKHFYHMQYPFSLYSISARNHNETRRDPFTPLVKAGLPSFPNYETAFYRFMLDSTYPSGNAIPRDLVVIRIAHPEAWIDSVETESNTVRVILNGNDCSGTQLTVGGSEGILFNEIINNDDKTQGCEIPDVQSDHLWAVLSRDDRWIDWRDIHINRVGGIGTWGVSGVQPANLAANIEQLRLYGENEQLEYKSKVPDKQDKLLKTVAAFANGSGGIVLIGIDDNGKVEGIRDDINRYMDGIVNSIRNRVVPPPTFQLAKCTIDNRQIVAVFVREGEEPPYGLNDKPPAIFVRRHGTTFDATPSEIRALGAKNQSSSEYQTFW